MCNILALLFMFAAGHATESFSEFVVGHGELWSSQMLSYAIQKVHMKRASKVIQLVCKFINV